MTPKQRQRIRRVAKILMAMPVDHFHEHGETAMAHAMMNTEHALDTFCDAVEAETPSPNPRRLALFRMHIDRIVRDYFTNAGVSNIES